jgi:hypothetical protein
MAKIQLDPTYGSHIHFRNIYIYEYGLHQPLRTSVDNSTVPGTA